jgi:2-dehydropantoate 2-reductase
MKIDIIGAGSMGIVLSYFLHKKHEVVLTVKHGETEFYRKGLTLIDKEKEEKFYLKISENVEDSDITVIAVKSYDLAGVFEKDGLKGKVILVQNGLSHMRVERKGITKIYAVTTWGARKLSKGVVELTGRGYFRLGSHSGKIDVNFLRDCGINAEWVEDINEELYRKAAINAVINPITAIYNVKNGEITNNRNLWVIASDAIKELEELFSELGYHLEIEKNVIETCRVTSDNTSSMLQDIQRGRKSEIDAITGEIISLGKEHGLEMKVNRFLYDSVRSLESHRPSLR